MRISWKLAALALAAALISPAIAPAQSSAVSVFVNGQRLSFDQPPVLQSGRVFVPLRGVFQALGASVVYNNGQINATGSGRTISLTIGSTTAVVNGQQQILDVAPFTVGDRTLVPLRFIAQALGANVNWDDSSSSVTITSGRGGGHPIAPPPPAPAPNVTLLSKSPTGTIFTNTPLIAFQLNRAAPVSAFRVTVDGTNVPTSSLNQRTNASFNFRIPPLGQGRHTVRVWGKTNGGIPFDMSWTFVLAAAR
jgi:Copper amine oxidase N-terminal domain